VQIADELAEHGRRVSLSVSTLGRCCHSTGSAWTSSGRVPGSGS
jgi:hypothetical protein